MTCTEEEWEELKKKEAVGKELLQVQIIDLKNKYEQLRVRLNSHKNNKKVHKEDEHHEKENKN